MTTKEAFDVLYPTPQIAIQHMINGGWVQHANKCSVQTFYGNLREQCTCGMSEFLKQAGVY